MKKKNSKKRLKKKLDRMFQEIYVKKYPKCFICPNRTSEMHHFINKARSLYLRWDERNGIPLCKHHHSLHHFGDSSIHAEILRIKGFEWWDDLNADRHKIMKNTMGNLQEIEERLKNEI